MYLCLCWLLPFQLLQLASCPIGQLPQKKQRLQAHSGYSYHMWSRVASMNPHFILVYQAAKRAPGFWFIAKSWLIYSYRSYPLIYVQLPNGHVSAPLCLHPRNQALRMWGSATRLCLFGCGCGWFNHQISGFFACGQSPSHEQHGVKFGKLFRWLFRWYLGPSLTQSRQTHRWNCCFDQPVNP